MCKYVQVVWLIQAKPTVVVIVRFILSRIIYIKPFADIVKSIINMAFKCQLVKLKEVDSTQSFVVKYSP